MNKWEQPNLKNLSINKTEEESGTFDWIVCPKCGSGTTHVFDGTQGRTHYCVNKDCYYNTSPIISDGNGNIVPPSQS